MILPQDLEPIRVIPVLWDIVLEHLEEAGSLWLDRERWLDEPRSSADMIALERRIRAHLDGLTWGGALQPTELARAAIRANDPGAIFAATFALVSRDRPETIAEVVSILNFAAGQHLDAALRAFALLNRVPQNFDVSAALASKCDSMRMAALAVCQTHNLDAGKVLNETFGSADIGLRRSALNLIAARKDLSSGGIIMDELDAPEATIRLAALRAGLILGIGAAVAVCRSNDAAWYTSRDVLIYRALIGEEQDIIALLRALDDRQCRLDALFALGFTHSKVAADACADACRDPGAGAIACEALSALIDVDPVKSGIADPASPPLSDMEFPPANRLKLQPEDLLPIPKPGAVRAFWETRRSGFAEVRPSPSSLAHKLERSSIRRRHVLATHLAILTHGDVVVDTRSWMCVQAILLAQKRTLDII